MGCYSGDDGATGSTSRPTAETPPMVRTGNAGGWELFPCPRRYHGEMRRLLPVLVLTLFLSAAASQPAGACSCAEPERDVTPDLTRAAAVFSGRVVGIEPHADGYAEQARFAVYRVWKGDLSDPVVRFEDEPSMCGYTLEQGRDYLVFAGRGGVMGEGDFLSTDLCSRTALLSQARGDLRQLGPGDAPPPPIPVPSKPDVFEPADLLPFLAAGVAALLLAAVAVAVRYRREYRFDD